MVQAEFRQVPAQATASLAEYRCQRGPNSYRLRTAENIGWRDLGLRGWHRQSAGVDIAIERIFFGRLSVCVAREANRLASCRKRHRQSAELALHDCNPCRGRLSVPPPMAAADLAAGSRVATTRKLPSLLSKLDTGCGMKKGPGFRDQRPGERSAFSFQWSVFGSQWSVVSCQLSVNALPLPCGGEGRGEGAAPGTSFALTLSLSQRERGRRAAFAVSSFILHPSSYSLLPTPYSNCNIRHLQRCTKSGSQATSLDEMHYKTSTKQARLVGQGRRSAT
jgi:hypothetical protein